MPTIPKTVRRTAPTWIALGLWACAASFAAAQEDGAGVGDPVVRVETPASELRLVEKFAKVVELRNRISRVDGFDPEVLTVAGVQGRPDRVRVFAVAPGVTTMVLTDEKDTPFTVEIFVTGDVRHLQAHIDRMFPQSSVKAVEVRDSVVLRGWVTQPEQITSIVEIAEQFYPRVLNQMQVGGAQQVQLKVKVMEVQRAKIRKLGFNFLYLDQNGYTASTPGRLVPLAGITAPIGGQPGVTFNAQRLADPSLAFGLVGNSELFQGFLEALKQESLLKILAEPELTTTNGRPAQMLAGGEFPILVPQSLGTVTIEWREFGVRLEAVPHILGQGRVRLELQPEVSDRDFTNAVSVNGQTVPGLTTRRVNTQVTMRFGETYILAGLLSTRKTAETFKVPLLGEVPWLGAAFRRVSYDESETELVIMVTPELAAPLQPGTLPDGGPGLGTSTPLDRDLYRDGLLEVPNYGDECVGCRNGHDGHGHPALAPVESGAGGTLPPAPAPTGPAPAAPGLAPSPMIPMLPPAPGSEAARRSPGAVQPAGHQQRPARGLIGPARPGSAQQVPAQQPASSGVAPVSARNVRPSQGVRQAGGAQTSSAPSGDGILRFDRTTTTPPFPNRPAAAKQPPTWPKRSASAGASANTGSDTDADDPAASREKGFDDRFLLPLRK